MKIMFGAAIALAVIGSSYMYAQPPQGGPGGPPNGGGPPRGPRKPEVIAPSIPIDLAVAAAKAAVSSCAGYKVGVAILDQAGEPKLYYVADGAGAAHATRAAHKASSALLINAPSEGLNDRVASDQAIAAKVKADKDSGGGGTYMGMAGGLPITVNGQVMGAIGVSGAEPSSKDEECAAAALKSIQGELK